jgi:hypothetical protein
MIILLNHSKIKYPITKLYSTIVKKEIMKHQQHHITHEHQDFYVENPKWEKPRL